MGNSFSSTSDLSPDAIINMVANHVDGKAEKRTYNKHLNFGIIIEDLSVFTNEDKTAKPNVVMDEINDTDNTVLTCEMFGAIHKYRDFDIKHACCENSCIIVPKQLTIDGIIELTKLRDELNAEHDTNFEIGWLMPVCDDFPYNV